MLLVLPLAGGCLVDIAGLSEGPVGTALEAPDGGGEDGEVVESFEAGHSDTTQWAPDASLDDAPVVDAGSPDAASDGPQNTIQEAGPIQVSQSCVQGALNLTDAFTSASLNAFKWTEYGTGSASGGPDAKLTIVPSAAATKGIRSVKTFDFSPGCAATVAVTAETDAVFALYAGTQSRVEIALEGTFLRVRWVDSGVGVVPGTIPYEASQHRHWRFIESGGKLLAEVSPDASTWSLVAQTGMMSGFRLQLSATYSGTPGASARFDDLNAAP
jgi:hypothetical protein